MRIVGHLPGAEKISLVDVLSQEALGWSIILLRPYRNEELLFHPDAGLLVTVSSSLARQRLWNVGETVYRELRHRSLFLSFPPEKVFRGRGTSRGSH